MFRINYQAGIGQVLLAQWAKFDRKLRTLVLALMQKCVHFGSRICTLPLELRLIIQFCRAVFSSLWHRNTHPVSDLPLHSSLSPYQTSTRIGTNSVNATTWPKPHSTSASAPPVAFEISLWYFCNRK